MSSKEHRFTLGIEEEFAIVDPQTRELRSHIQEILEGGKVVLKEQIKPEMHQSVVELGTEICDSIEHARTHVIDLRSKLAELAGKAGSKSRRLAPTRFRTGGTSTSPKANVTSRSFKTCNCSPARISFLDCTCTWAYPIAKWLST